MEFFDDVDFDLLKITFWALKMHQNTSLDVQIFKISRGRSPGPPPSNRRGTPRPVPAPLRGALVSRIQFNFLLLLFMKMKTLLYVPNNVYIHQRKLK